MSDLAGMFYGDYGMAEATARRRRSQESIANQQAATLGQMRGTRGIADLTRQFTEGFRPQMASYGKRGLAGPNVASGIQRAGLQRYAADMQGKVGEATQSLQDELNRLSQTEASQTADLDAYLQQLALAKQQKIFNAASALKEYGA
jgi:hypothetical protein